MTTTSVWKRRQEQVQSKQKFRHVVHTTFEPIGHGRCRVSIVESPEAQVSYEEQSGDFCASYARPSWIMFATITQRCKMTDTLEKMEVWALRVTRDQEQRLTRTTTDYNSGDVASVNIARERKVS
eukprot:TRINITY_DN36899_c0_g1_i1.p1 TRINITY_DN36899_c0_g1~~TRINITY_DN36899_c0_g1_i1.p1  ORF type:complete len:125 (+),score=15.44 TRINITY_DN36899_c0_g1_i1:313-687(+)